MIRSINRKRFPLVIAISTAILFSLSTLNARAQQDVFDLERFAFAPGIPVDESIPSPSSFLGYELGTQLTVYSDVAAYIHAVSEASDRISIHEYGRTYENRALHYLVITSPSNHTSIESLRANNLRLADPSLPDAEAEQLIAEQPIVPWLSYNVHGNEPSSTEAAMQVIYQLAANQDSATKELLDRAIVIIDPALNPDGRDRYVNWYRSVQSHVLNQNAGDLEHAEPWPGGRTNHYWFDLNRDWVWLVHPESRGRLEAYHEWLPQIHVDYHEQGYNSNYFTMPGQTPRNRNLPDEYDDWAEVFGQANARAFDEAQVNYFTRESFDFFYPGYGSSYPSNLGAIGMLTEQGGGSRAARAVESNDGYVLTLRQRVFDHYTTSMAALHASVENRAELLSYFRRFFTQSANKSKTSAYLINDDGGDGYAYDIIRLLLDHGVEVERATEDFTVRQSYDYWDGAASTGNFDSGTFIVRTNQARHVLINTLMQREMAIEDSVMYDMATWSIPLAYNLEAAWTESDLRVSSERVAEAPEHDFGVVNSDAGYAFAIDWKQRHAPRALVMLWKADYNVRSVQKTFTVRGTTYSRGTLIILQGRNREKAESVEADMKRIAEDARVRIVGFDSGRVDDGIDLASNSSRPVAEPRVALVVDSPMSSYTAGQLWFLFDRWTGLGIDRVRARNLMSSDLNEYDVLLFPGGNLASVFDSVQTERLKQWVSSGGVLVATESTAIFFTNERSKFTGVKLAQRDDAEDEKDDNKEIPERHYTTYEARSDSSGLRRVPGSAMRGIVDTSHPLAFGVGKRLYSLKFNADALEPSESLQTVAYYDRDWQTVLASGYASRENRETIAGKAFAAVQPMGAGKVVFLVDNTQYRMFWVGPARLVQNAVLLLPGM